MVPFGAFNRFIIFLVSLCLASQLLLLSQCVAFRQLKSYYQLACALLQPSDRQTLIISKLVGCVKIIYKAIILWIVDSHLVPESKKISEHSLYVHVWSEAFNFVQRISIIILIIYMFIFQMKTKRRTSPRTILQYKWMVVKSSPSSSSRLSPPTSCTTVSPGRRRSLSRFENLIRLSFCLCNVHGYKAIKCNFK